MVRGVPCDVSGRIARHGSILSAMTELCCELVDSWEDPVPCPGIPFATEAEVIAYSGFCLRHP